MPRRLSLNPGVSKYTETSRCLAACALSAPPARRKRASASRPCAGSSNFNSISLPMTVDFPQTRFAAQSIRNVCPRENVSAWKGAAFAREPSVESAAAAVVDSSHTVRRLRAILQRRTESDAKFPAGARGAAVGRSPLLSPQPHQSEPAPGERGLFPVRLRADLHRSGRGRAGRLAAGDDDPADRPRLFRAQGLRRGEPGD